MLRTSLVRLSQQAGKATESSAGPTLNRELPEMETMMPWKGWVGRWLSEKMGAEKYQKLRNFLVFREDDIHNLVGQPESARLTMPGVERIKGFRYPAPGSRGPVSIPTVDLNDDFAADPYNTGYYWRDTKRNTPAMTSFSIVGSAISPEQTKLVAGAVKVTVREEDVENGKMVESVMSLNPAKEQLGSPGNKGVFATGPSDFDPSGLRSAMQTNWDALNKAIAERQPTQLVSYEWEEREQEILQLREEKNMGTYAGDGTKWRMPKKSRLRRRTWGRTPETGQSGGCRRRAG